MNSDDKKDYWFSLSDYDLETAKAMLQTKRWLYVGFMCHQAVEKTLKGYWCYKQPTNDPPYQHNLFRLIQGAGLEHKMTDEMLDFVSELMPLNIEARYPSYKEKLFQTMTEEYCKTLIDKTTRLIVWIRQQL